MKIKDGFAVRMVLGEPMLMPIDHNSHGKEIYSLNEVAAFILSQMEKNVSKTQILDAVLKEYDVDKQTAEPAVDSLIAQFSSIGVVVEIADSENEDKAAECCEKQNNIMQKRIGRKPGLVASDMNDSVVMLDTESGKYYNLGEVGGAIWGILEAPMTTDEIITSLLKEFSVDRETCEKDTIPFLKSLVAKGILIEF